jgi:hypothetical protein
MIQQATLSHPKFVTAYRTPTKQMAKAETGKNVLIPLEIHSLHWRKITPTVCIKMEFPYHGGK